MDFALWLSLIIIVLNFEMNDYIVTVLIVLVVKVLQRC